MASKRHHYIPQFYLAQWTGADGRLCQFSRPYQCVVPKRTHPSGTGYQTDLYALTGVDDSIQQYLEDSFLKIADQHAHDALLQLLAGNVDLSQKLRSGWSRFIMSLLSRTPERIALLRKMFADELANRGVELEKAYDDYHANDECQPSSKRKAADILRAKEVGVGQLIQSVMDLENVGNHINGMRWVVYDVGKVQRSLLTSDRPVFLSRGLQYADAHITIPLSPMKLFIAANAEFDFRAIRGSAPGDVVSRCNRIVVSQATKFVYGTDDFQRNFVEKYLGAPSAIQ